VNTSFKITVSAQYAYADHISAFFLEHVPGRVDLQPDFAGWAAAGPANSSMPAKAIDPARASIVMAASLGSGETKE
jgi:hypothetical protein